MIRSKSAGPGGVNKLVGMDACFRGKIGLFFPIVKEDEIFFLYPCASIICQAALKTSTPLRLKLPVIKEKKPNAQIGRGAAEEWDPALTRLSVKNNAILISLSRCPPCGRQGEGLVGLGS